MIVNGFAAPYEGKRYFERTGLVAEDEATSIVPSRHAEAGFNMGKNA
jgi:hypothetical protein